MLSIAEPDFDVLVTIDQGIEDQQNLAIINIAVLVINVHSNRIEDLAPLIPAALAALGGIQPGKLVRIG